MSVPYCLCAEAADHITALLGLHQNLGVRHINYSLPGVFTSNQYAGTVDGSLWNLTIEDRSHAVVLILGVMGPSRHVNAACWSPWT